METHNQAAAENVAAEWMSGGCTDEEGLGERDGFSSASFEPRPQLFNDVAQFEDRPQLQSHVLHHHLAV